MVARLLAFVMWGFKAALTGLAAEAARPEHRRKDGLLVPLLALGTVSLLTGLALVDMPLGSAHIALITGVGLTGAAVVAALIAPRGDPGNDQELARFHALGDRLEKGIERLKDLQWELSDNETRYRDLLDSQNDIITRVDRQGRLTFVNRAFCRTFGVEAGAVLGTAFRPEVLQQEGDAEVAPDPARRQRFEQLVITAEGARWYAFEQHAITGEEGRVREIQQLGRDVTEQRRTQAALAEARDQAEAANRAKSRFLAAMSHEIRTPMNGILGMTSLLSETPLTAEQRSYLSAVDHSAKTLLTIIDEILDLSKIEAGKLEIHPAPFHLDECVQSVVELLAPRARAKRLDLAWRVEPTLPKQVLGDETRVRQILLNLVGNAIKFTDLGGIAVRVKLAALSPGEAKLDDGSVAVELEISDTGIGIDPERAASLFGEFEQADDVMRRKRSGSGLGLAISRRLARAMNGDISYQSSPGKGSVFLARIVLGHGAGSRSLILRRPIRAPLRVGLLSERRQSRTVMGEILGSIGIASTVLDTDVLTHAALADPTTSFEFDTVVADAEIGAEVIGRLIGAVRKATGRAPRALLVVENPGGGQLDAFRAVGCDAYLVRPVRPSSLLTQLDLALHPEPEAEPVDLAPVVSVSSRPESIRQHNILIVDDNDINALLAKRMSERAGCRAHHASSGAAALAHCDANLSDETSTYDLVLMDIHMPEMDGFETARRIKRLFAARGRVAPPIVALTANAFAEDRKRCLEAGLDDYLAKPFDRAELEALLEKWCSAHTVSRDGSIGDFAA